MVLMSNKLFLFEPIIARIQSMIIKSGCSKARAMALLKNNITLQQQHNKRKSKQITIVSSNK